MWYLTQARRQPQKGLIAKKLNYEKRLSKSIVDSTDLTCRILGIISPHLEHMKYLFLILIPFIASAGVVSTTTYTKQLPQPTIFKGIVSAYNAQEDQTDSTPFITANGDRVYEGGIANNCLDFGTEVEINNKTYTVNDRMNSRYGCEYFDLFLWSEDEAWEFGRQELAVVVY